MSSEYYISDNFHALQGTAQFQVLEKKQEPFHILFLTYKECILSKE